MSEGTLNFQNLQNFTLDKKGLPYIPPPVSNPLSQPSTEESDNASNDNGNSNLDLDAIRADNSLTLFEKLGQTLDKDRVMALLQFKQDQGLDNDDALWQFLIQFKTIENAVSKQEDILNLIINEFDGKLKQQLHSNQQKIDTSYRTYSQDLLNQYKNLTENLKTAEESSINLTNTKIASSVDALVQKAAYKKAISNWLAMSRLGIYIFIPAILTFISGWLGRSYFDYRYSNSGLSNQDTALLEWVRSDEGKLARDLMNWNKRGLTTKGRSLICESEAQKLDLTLKKEGESVKAGWCALWVKSPDRR